MEEVSPLLNAQLNFLTSLEGLEAMKDAAIHYMKTQETEEESVKKVSIDPRKAKIKELKQSIKDSNDRVVIMITSGDPNIPKTEEENQKIKDTLAIEKAKRQGAEEEIKLLKLNKTSSKFFEWHPNKQGNRRQAKALKHAKRRGGKKKYE